MKWSDYSSLESAGKVAFSADKETTKEAVEAKDAVLYKEGDDLPEGVEVGDVKESAVLAEAKVEREFVVFSQKQYDGETGEALSDKSDEYTLAQLEGEVAHYDSQAAKAKAESDGVKAAIVDFKKL